jgi:hypothetical protein
MEFCFIYKKMVLTLKVTLAEDHDYEKIMITLFIYVFI